MSRAKDQPINILDRVGIIKDLSPDQIADGGWQDGKNVRFINGKVQALLGYQRFFATAVQAGASQRIMHGDQLSLLNGSIYLVVATLTKLYYWVTGTSSFTDISGGFSFTGGVSNYFMTDVGFNLFLVANGIDVAKKWAGPGGNIATLGGLSTAAPLGGGVIPKILRPFQNFLIALNNTEDGAAISYRCRWSKIGQAEIWVNDGSGNGQAGYNDLNDTPTGIINALQLSNYLAIYKSDGIYLMSYIGLPAIFDFRKAVIGRGLLAPRALISVGSMHFFLSNDNFYAFDGAQINPIGGFMKDYFFNDLNPKYSDRTQAVLMQQYGEIWWAYCSLSSTGDFDKVLIYSYRNHTWSFATFAATALFLYTLQSDVTWANQPDLLWNVVPGLWNDIQLVSSSPLLMMGDANSIVFQHGLVYSQDGASYTKQAISKLYDFGKPGIFKRLQRVQLSTNLLGLTNLQVYVGTVDYPGGTITWSGPYTIRTGFGGPSVEVDLTGVYFAFRFESTGINDSWEVRGFTPYFIERGVQ